MPKVQQHLEQAQSNEQLAKNMCGGESHYDWAVTISFYAALHYLDAYLLKKSVYVLQEATAKGEGAHALRRKKAKAMLPSDESRRYITLQQQSERARYFTAGDNRPLPNIPARYFTQGMARQSFAELEKLRDYLANST